MKGMSKIVDTHFREVGQLMLEAIFSELECDAENLRKKVRFFPLFCLLNYTYPTKPVVPENQGLPEPS